MVFFLFSVNGHLLADFAFLFFFPLFLFFFFGFYKMLFLPSDVLYDFSCQGVISSCVGIREML